MVAGQLGKKIGAVIQARYDSTRLPGKVLLPLPYDSNETILSHIIARLKSSALVDSIVLATSDEAIDTAVADEGRKRQVDVFRGSKNDVLQRFYDAAQLYNLDVIIRLTGDNPIVLLDQLEMALRKHVNGHFDYTRLVGLPYGTTFEIVSFSALEKMLHSDPSEQEREHVTLYIKNNIQQFRYQEIENPTGFDTQSLRLTVDYPNDYALLNILFCFLRQNNYQYTLDDILSHIAANSWLTHINNANIQKKPFANFQEELQEGMRILHQMGLKNVVKLLQNPKEGEK